MVADKKAMKLAAAFLAIANRYASPGWIEYLLWEVLEEKRDRPFKFLEPLSAEDMAVLAGMRDEVKIWLHWTDKWELVSIDDWQEHAGQTSADEVLSSL